MVKVYTRKGDKGMTSIKGKKVSKGSEVIELIGLIDNLQTVIGFVIVSTDLNKEFHQLIQKELFTMSSYIAGYSVSVNALFENVLELEIDKLTETLLPLCNFIFAGDNIAECYAHKCRVDCRTLERQLIKFLDTVEDKEVYSNIIKIINRLSDYFFTVCRCLNKNEVKIEIKTGNIF